jgi:predicted Zn finger-like uncharacterized protein
MSVVRLRRLQSDYDRVNHLTSHHPRLQLVKAEGSPPEKYQIEFKVKSLRQKDGQLMEIASHLVEIFLPRDYPRTPPLCRMLTPVFHPNIAPHAICIGDHWSAGESLSSLVERIGEMLAYQSYNTKSPLNGEAAKWCDQNLERLPLDKVNMRVEDGGAGPPPKTASVAPAAVAPAAAAPPVSAPLSPAPAYTPPPPLPSQHAAAAPAAASAVPSIEVQCPGCAARIRVRVGMGAQVRCPRCKTIINMPQSP